MNLIDSVFRDTWDVASPDARTGLLQERVNAVGRHAYDAMRQAGDWRVVPPQPIAGLKTAILAMVVRNEADIVGENLRHHHALGFRRFFVLDHGSTDATAAIIAGFRAAHPGAAVIYAYDFVKGHHHAEKMQAIEAFIRPYFRFEAIRPEWLFAVDADEFLAFGGAAAQAGGTVALERCLADPLKLLLVFHWVQCSSRTVRESLDEGVDVFSAYPETWRRMKVPVTKVAYRLGRGFVPVQGNHAVARYDGSVFGVRVAAEFGMFLFHIPVRTVAQVRGKLLNAKAALRETDPRSLMRPVHWVEYTRLHDEHGEAAVRGIVHQHMQEVMRP